MPGDVGPKCFGDTIRPAWPAVVGWRRGGAHIEQVSSDRGKTDQLALPEDRNGMMAIPNLIALLVLAKVVVREKQDALS